VLDLSLHALHLVAVAVYAGGGFMLHGPLRRALRMIPPGQASIVGSRVGRDFTYLSWMSLVLLGLTGYWMAFRYGWADVSAPSTLWINPLALQTSKGMAMLVMALAWLIIVISAAIITFVLRPRLSLRVTSDATVEAANRAVATISRADRWLDILALANFGLATVALLAGAFFH
jgi:uncharacterized membrane protein